MTPIFHPFLINSPFDDPAVFVEATFLQAEAERAAERSHLTARQAGELARAAGVGRVIPFHFSPKYRGREEEILEEMERAWRGEEVR